MSPVEEFAEARRSGLYDREWPEKPEEIAAHNPTGPQSHNEDEDYLAIKESLERQRIRQQVEKEQRISRLDEERSKKNRTNTKGATDTVLFIILAVWLLIVSIVLFVHINENVHVDKKTKKEVVYKTRYKTKKIKVVEVPKDYRETKENLATAKQRIRRLIARNARDTWRKKLCYGYGDWDACLAYKKNLPLRARVGREDLY